MRETVFIWMILFLSFSSCQDVHDESRAEQLFEHAQLMNQTGSLENALETYIQASRLAKKAGRNELLGQIYLEIADLLECHDFKKQALDVYKQACEVTRHLEDKTLLSRSLRGIGKSYLPEAPHLAFDSINKAYSLLAQVKDSNEVGRIYNNLAWEMLYWGDYQQARKFVDLSSLQIKDSLGHYNNCLLKALLLNQEENWQEALPLYEKALCSPSPFTQLGALWGKSRMYQMEGDSIEALAYNLDFQNKWHQQILKSRPEALWEVWYTYLNPPQNSSRYWTGLFWGMLGGFFLFLVLSYWYWFQKKKGRAGLPVDEVVESILPVDDSGCPEIEPVLSKITMLKEQDKRYNRNKEQIEITFSYTEIDLLTAYLKKTFAAFFQELNDTAPTLSHSEQMYCCLYVKLELNNYCIARCLNLSPSGIRQYKARILRKLNSTEKGKALAAEYFHI